MNDRWHEQVASQAEAGLYDVEVILKRRGVRTRRGARPARRLRIISIAFSGEKKGKATGRFDFKWAGLGDGVWAVASDGTNLVGKSTVLEIMLWSLRGDIKSLQADVRKWLEHVRTDFTLDSETFAVDFEVRKGVPNGRLVRIRPDKNEDEIDAFQTLVGFASVMSEFMMEALDLDPIPFQQGKDEAAKVAEHGWKALSGGLYFWGEHQRLLGETDFGGLPGRILQLYVGMPWASTVMQASAALKDIGTEELRAKAVQRTAFEMSAKAIEQTQTNLAAAQERLSKLTNDADFAQSVDDLAEAVVEATKAYNEIERRLATAEEEAQTLCSAADFDEREARGIRETFVASNFFNGLQPTCCPRCETAVTQDRIKREQSDFSCSVCNEPMPAEKMEGVNERLAQAEDRATATHAAADRAVASGRELRQLAKIAFDKMTEARQALGAAPASSGLRERRNIELEIAKLEGMLKAHSESTIAPSAAPDRRVVAAAHDLAKSAMDAAARKLLSELDDEVLALAQRFGFVSLESVEINSQAQMNLRKGGASAAFADVTKGERLRLRIATAIALLRVGKKLGVGRHPGLLIIDSPGAEETDDSNLEALLKELRCIADDEVGLQVFVSSAKAARSSRC